MRRNRRAQHIAPPARKRLLPSAGWRRRTVVPRHPTGAFTYNCPPWGESDNLFCRENAVSRGKMCSWAENRGQRRFVAFLVVRRSVGLGAPNHCLLKANRSEERRVGK